jgi:hypothetical protein
MGAEHVKRQKVADLCKKSLEKCMQGQGQGQGQGEGASTDSSALASALEELLYGAHDNAKVGLLLSESSHAGCICGHIPTAFRPLQDYGHAFKDCVALLQGKREGNDLAAMGAGLVAGTLTMDAIVELVRVAHKEDMDVVKKAVGEAGVEEGEAGEEGGAKKKKKKKKKKKVPGEEEAGAAEEILQIAQLRLIDMVYDASSFSFLAGVLFLTISLALLWY